GAGLLQVLPGPDRHDAVDVDGPGDVDVDDPGVGVRAADERGGQGLVAEVVQVAAVAADEPGVLAALDARADGAGAHACSSRSSGWPVVVSFAVPAGASPRRISAARHTDFTMFW